MARPSLDPDGDVVVRKVKMSRAMSDRLDALAKEADTTVSELIRSSVEGIEREAKRQAAHRQLVRWAEKDAHLLRSRSWRANGGFK
jgi:predicted transcriptional regulator